GGAVRKGETGTTIVFASSFSRTETTETGTEIEQDIPFLKTYTVFNTDQCDYPDGRLEIMHESFTLPYRTFDTLRSVHRAEVVENKRLDDMLSIVAELQAGREQQRSKSGPRRTGQTDHMFGIPDGSQGNGYQKRGRKPGRRTDFMNDPEVIAKRQKALMRQPAE
ncbi:ArdC-like ssDNA-binding domain-containing protein, partial [Rhizobium ruizarguesonis]